MNCLVTGSTGFIGSHLCRTLCEHGHRVRAFHRATSSLRLLEGLDVEHVVGDLTQPETLQPALEGMEAVFHVAAWTGNEDQAGRLYAVTVEGTRSLLAAARRVGVRRVVYTSSAAALGVPETGPEVDGTALINEYHTWNYRPDFWPQGYAKYLAELEVQKAVAAGLDAVIVNPTWVVGAGDIFRKTSSLVMQIARRRVPVVVEGGLNAVHVSDVVDGHLLAFERGLSGERYLLGGHNLSVLELARQIAEVVGVAAPGMVFPTGLARFAAGPLGWFRSFVDLPIEQHLLRLAGRTFYYSSQKAEAQLGLPEPRDFQLAVQEAYAWFQQA